MPGPNTTQQWLMDLFTSIDNKNTRHFADFLADDVKFRFGNMPAALGKPAACELVEHFFGSIKSLKHELADYFTHEASISCHGTVTYTRLDDSTLNVPFANIFKIGPQGISEYLIFADVSGLYR